MEQPVKPAMTKFVLVVMAECVNAEAGTMECWPSYAFIARRASMNTKTVEASVFRLKQDRYILDTGKRAGETGKVIVYRLNDPNSGAVTPGLTGSANTTTASGARPRTTPNPGAFDATGNPPKSEVNPPKFADESPQIVEVTTPKQGVRTRNGIRNGTGKEPGIEAAVAALPEVPEAVLRQWLPIRREKRAGPVSVIVADALRREAAKAELSPADAVSYCCEVGWQNFNAGYWAKREGLPPIAKTKGRKHAGFENKDYREGVTADGNLI